MPETLKNRGDESSDKKTSGFDELADAVEFNPEEAARVVQGRIRLKTPETATPAHSEVSEKNKPVGELTSQEAAREYLDLLLDLSANFTSPEGKTSRVAEYDRDGNLVIANRAYNDENNRIVGQIYGVATGKDFSGERRKFETGEQVDDYMDRELTLNLADNIISAESDWRAAGESTTIENEQIEHATLETAMGMVSALLGKIDIAQKRDSEENLNESNLDRFKRRMFGSPNRVPRGEGVYVHFGEEEISQLRDFALRNSRLETKADKATARANHNLRLALEAAYSEDYGHGHHELRDERNADKVNDKYNEMFFGGDKDRQDKIDRAVKLRQRLKTEGIIKRTTTYDRRSQVSEE